MAMKKGVYFTFDAFFATMLLIIGVILITKFSAQEISTEQIDLLSKDLLDSFGELKVSEVNNTWVQHMIASGNITNPDNSIIDQIGTFWAMGQIEYAQNLSDIMIYELVPERYGASIYMEDDIVFLKNKSEDPTNLITSRRMITGIEEGAPVEGSSSTAYIRKIKNKQTSSYAYFGGFIGQGNVTIFIDDIPSDVINETINLVELEIDAGENFSFYINNELCNSSLYVATQNMTPMRWNLTYCKNSIDPGRNNFTVNFGNLTNESYIAGGYVRVSYLTNITNENVSLNTSRYNFPDIEGLINIYDGFYVPGILTSMNISLHYFSNHSSNTSNFSTFIAIGDTIVYNDSNSTTEQNVFINNTHLESVLNYSFLSQKTVPLRMSSYEYIIEEVITSGNADVILITDLSGSMKKSISNNTQLGHAATNCENMYERPDSRKTEIAKCMDDMFVEVLMNYSGNRIWPVAIKNDEILVMNESRNWSVKQDILDELDTYNGQGSGKTCLACAVNAAYDLLDMYSEDNKSKFIVLMTDGVPTHCAEDSCPGESLTYLEPQECNGYCDTNGAACGPIEGCNDDLCDLPENNTIYSANRSVEDLNASIYTIGFGLIGECSRATTLLQTIADMNNGTYQNSSNVTMLQMIYEGIAYDILERSATTSQMAIINETPIGSKLFGDSKIDVEYVPVDTVLAPSEVSVVFQSEQFNGCNTTINISPGMRVTEARVTSYSDYHWTNEVIVNNNTIFRLQDFASDYIALGDPFTIEIPSSLIISGSNNISMSTADTPVNITGCSDNNTLIYKGFVNFTSTRTSVVEMAEGCNWTIEFEDGSFVNESIPSNYNGTSKCNYTSLNISYNPIDAYDIAVYNLLRSLDYDNDGRVLFNFDAEDLEIVVNIVSGIPYLWGPSIIEVRMWQ